VVFSALSEGGQQVPAVYGDMMDPLRKNLPGNHEDDAGAYLPMPEEIELAKLRLRRKHLADKLAEKSTHYASEPGIRYCRVSNGRRHVP